MKRRRPVAYARIPIPPFSGLPLSLRLAFARRGRFYHATGTETHKYRITGHSETIINAVASFSWDVISAAPLPGHLWQLSEVVELCILLSMSNDRVRESVMKDPVSWLYPPLEPYNTGRLRVSPVHEIYFEESGNPSGKPVVFLHGGPGGGSEPKQRRFFHPDKYRIVNFDQRGCGKSTPYASLEANTTWDLVGDIEKIREHLGIERWQVFGGSWGSTLALAYSETHPDRVTELVLRGIFLLRKQEIDWFYQRGASVLYPDAWEPYVSHIPEPERGDLLLAYYRRLTSEDPAVRLAAAKIWSAWEGATSKLLPDAAFTAHYEEDEFALAFARIEAHYFVNKGFMKTDAQLLEDTSRIRHIPGVIVQGRYDVVCPMESAWALHRAWPEADLIITPDSGHSAFDPPNSRALIAATDKFAH